MTRIYAWLIDEHQMGDVSYQVVRAYVAQRRPQIRVEHGREPVNAFIVQSHLPGMEAEVDFGEVAIRAPRRAGDLSPVLPAVSYSGNGVHRVPRRGSWAPDGTRERHAAMGNQHRAATRDRAIADSLDAMVQELKRGNPRNSGHVEGTATG